MLSSTRSDDLRRIRRALESVANMVSCTNLSDVTVRYARNGDPVTTLDRDINRILLEKLPAEGEGWLSEESSDSLDRLPLSRVWIVDPIDGTREFVEGIPEWCVSIALIEERQAVAGGILNPCTGEMFIGSLETGLEILGPVRPKQRDEKSTVPCMLVSRREHRRGKWARFECSGVTILSIGSIAYRLAQVASGYAEATCTFEPRSEWDIAGGVALVHAAGGKVRMLDGTPVTFNNAVPRLQSVIALGKGCPPSLPDLCGAKVR